ncbi:MAG: hypothetical protein LBP22_14505 [Deltaproteobacteria bacterium]|jgi:hypothetical protein|nr:hypothetical protein [Deltaproteobacteria bacterium]
MNPVKEFSITGPCSPSEHCMLPVIPRLPGAEEMTGRNFYFMLKALRQQGI